MKKPSHIEKITQKNVDSVLKMEHESIDRRSRAEIIADEFARCVGSWTFLIIQSILLALWVTLNVTGTLKTWDPYPFVLLNLVLSFQAAYATPVILMSQNRQTRLSERRNQLDLQVNLLAEQENTQQLRLLRMLCEKVGVELPAADAAALEEALRPEVVIKQIVEKSKHDSR